MELSGYSFEFLSHSLIDSSFPSFLEVTSEFCFVSLLLNLEMIFTFAWIVTLFIDDRILLWKRSSSTGFVNRFSFIHCAELLFSRSRWKWIDDCDGSLLCCQYSS